MRLHAQTATIENGFVYLPRETHWLADYLHELTVFPNGRYDDQVDSTSQALAWTKHRPRGWGLLEYTRQLADIATGRVEPPRVQLKAPPGITYVYTLSGQQFLVQDALTTSSSTPRQGNAATT